MFGAVSGSTQATVVAVGTPLRPRMLKAGYKDSFVLAGKTFIRTGIPTRQGDVLMTDVRCPAGVTTTRAAIASAYLSGARAPLAVPPQLQIKTDPATCAPS